MLFRSDVFSWIIWIVLLFVLSLFGPKLMLFQYLTRLENAALKMEIRTRKGKELIVRKIGRREVRKAISNFLDFFVIEPVSLDPFGIIRKLEHIDIVVNREVEGPLTNFFEYIFLIHDALPKVSPEEVNIKVKFLGRELLAPIVISGMTGGAPGTEKINEEIAKVAEEFKIAVGVGSQRAALFNPSVRGTYTIVRKICEEVPIIANIGISEVVELPLNKIEDAVNMIEADALAIHLNLPQEFVQPEGRISLSNALVKLGDLVHRLNVPIIIKEVGFGLSMEVVKRLAKLGVKIFDIAGAGGTNWVIVEKYRARVLRVGDLINKAKAEADIVILVTHLYRERCS